LSNRLPHIIKPDSLAIRLFKLDFILILEWFYFLLLRNRWLYDTICDIIGLKEFKVMILGYMFITYYSYSMYMVDS